MFRFMQQFTFLFFLHCKHVRAHVCVKLKIWIKRKWNKDNFQLVINLSFVLGWATFHIHFYSSPFQNLIFLVGRALTIRMFECFLCLCFFSLILLFFDIFRFDYSWSLQFQIQRILTLKIYVLLCDSTIGRCHLGTSFHWETRNDR